MLRKLAVKRLTASDLTFFKYQFRNGSAGNQKAINLNADVFIDELYPGLPTTPSAMVGNIQVSLSIYGPGLDGEYNLQRKIAKGPSYKNWRLNGEFVDNPDENLDRFDVLVGGDLAVFEFFGDARPESVRVVFVGNGVPEDAPLHLAFNGVVGSRPSMVSLTPTELEGLAKASGVGSDHPIFGLVSLEAAIEVVTLGDRSEATGLRYAPSGRKVPRDLLRKARSSSERVGDLGEQFVNSYLTALKSEGAVEDFEWTSLENAGSPYDFRVRLPGEQVLVDAKATESGFGGRVHVSLGELRQMGYGAERYDLYRVFEMGEKKAKLRVAEDVGSWARSVVEALEGLPEGVLAEGITVPPSKLSFGPEVEVEMIVISDEFEEQPPLTGLG